MMLTRNLKKERRERRHKRVRSRVSGTAKRPRLSVYRSNRALYGQLVDDEQGITLAAVSTERPSKDPLSARAFVAGKKLAEIAKEQKITKTVFDRGGFLYAGSIKAFADGAREGGLSF